MEETIKNEGAREKPFSQQEISSLLEIMEEAYEESLSCLHSLKEIPFEIGLIRKEGAKKNCPPILSERREKFISECQSQCLEMALTASKLVEQFDSFNGMLLENDLLSCFP